MSDDAFDAFLAALREVMESRNQDPNVLDTAADRSHARLPCPNGSWFVIQREHLEPVGGTPREMAEAVYDVFCEDNGLL